MLKDQFGAWMGGRKELRRKRRDRAAGRFLALESLDQRIVPAVTARFSAAAGVLTIVGDFRNNQITVSRTAAGQLRVNNGAVRIVGRQATVARTNLIQVIGQGGNDVITLNESRGPLPRANLFGGAGNDTLNGGSNFDLLIGQGGNDTLRGKAGADLLVGGDGNDSAFGDEGDDRMVWSPGDDNDLNEGGAGNDTVEVNGGDGAETFAVSANGTRVRFDRVNPAPFSIDIGTSENLVLNANGGDDTVSVGTGLATLIQLTVDGGAGNDVLNGGDGAELLIGGAGDDFIDGNRGNDVAFLGDGNDVFQWDPGDGSDTVEGQAGTDTLQFNGANANENIDVSANGSRVRFFRDVASVTMDLDDVERVNFEALGGADVITVNDLTGTDLLEVNLRLAGTFGGNTGDGQQDRVIVNGTAGADSIRVAGNSAGVGVTGLVAGVFITSPEVANDQLIINGLAGADTIDASGLAAGAIQLTLDGGDDADLLVGSAGNDLVFGRRGDDIALLGAGDDTFVWNPGDGSDVEEGQAGTDTLQFNGANANENVNVSANGSRVRFFRDVANVTMDLNDVERVNFEALGGTDVMTVNDLTGTDLLEVNLRLAATLGGSTGDGQSDSVIVNGTNGNDTITVAGNPASVAVTGLVATVTITGADAAGDLLTVNALGGNDVVSAAGLAAGSIGFKVDGGAGDDVLTGGAGDDTLLGGPGTDTLDGGPGTDVETQD